MMNFDPLNQEKEAKGVFNNYVDLLVIKTFWQSNFIQD